MGTTNRPGWSWTSEEMGIVIYRGHTFRRKTASATRNVMLAETRTNSPEVLRCITPDPMPKR
jgi:hypothetical protein